jgi:hypothetical protein
MIQTRGFGKRRASDQLRRQHALIRRTLAG